MAKLVPDLAVKNTLCGSALIALVLLSLVAAISSAFITSVGAQSLADKFGGFSKNSNEPINIEADQLRVNDQKKTAIFVGNVKAVQGDFVLRSKTLEVFYDGGGAKKGASGKVKRLLAKDTVLITTKDKQSATSQWADFDVAKQLIVLGDHVVLTQGGNVIKGGRLIINLKTRQSRFDRKKTGKGRVQMSIDVSKKIKKKKKVKAPE